MSAVTNNELLNVLRWGSPELRLSLADRIEQHGIAPPDGMVLVPKEPTFKMCEAGGFKWEFPLEGGFPSAYRAMLAAAPEVSNER